MKHKTETLAQHIRGGYESPQLRTVPVSCGGAMLVGSMQGSADGGNMEFYYESQGSEPGNSATEYKEAGSDQGWDNSFF